MKFPYMVKFNGIYFNAGEEVPNGLNVGETLAEEKPEPSVEVEEPKAKKSTTKKTK